MKLNRDNQELKAYPNFKGGNKELQARMYVDENVRILSDAVLVKGASIGIHTHDGSCEIIHIIKGIGTAICEGVEETLYPGDTHYCKAGQTHTLINNGDDDLEFFAVVPNIK